MNFSELYNNNRTAVERALPLCRRVWLGPEKYEFAYEKRKEIMKKPDKSRLLSGWNCYDYLLVECIEQTIIHSHANLV